MTVALVTDKELCEKLVEDCNKNSILLWQYEDDKTPVVVHVIEGVDSKEILVNVLEILPNPETLNEQQFRVGDSR